MRTHAINFSAEPSLTHPGLETANTHKKGRSWHFVVKEHINMVQYLVMIISLLNPRALLLLPVMEHTSKRTTRLNQGKPLLQNTYIHTFINTPLRAFQDNLQFFEILKIKKL